MYRLVIVLLLLPLIAACTKHQAAEAPESDVRPPAPAVERGMNAVHLGLPLALSAGVVSAQGVPLPRQIGDVNGDGFVWRLDVYFVLHVVIGSFRLSPADAWCGDVFPLAGPNGAAGDGRLTLEDAAVLLRIVEGEG